MTRFELDVAALYAALDQRRELYGLAWRDVAQETGISASTYSRMGDGRKPDADALCTLVVWLGLSLRQFVRPTRTVPAECRNQSS